ncbi:hypothetical protein DFP72DRAFT_790648, partial [Ephemerocybe angulata]
KYHLKGLIYYGTGHFTCRIVKNNESWFHDGLVTGRSTINEGLLTDLGDLKVCNGKAIQTAFYVA